MEEMHSPKIGWRSMFVQIFQAVHLDINIHKPIISEYTRITSYGCFLKWGYPISSSNLMGLSTINQPFGGTSMCGIPFILVIPTNGKTPSEAASMVLEKHLLKRPRWSGNFLGIPHLEEKLDILRESAGRQAAIAAILRLMKFSAIEGWYFNGFHMLLQFKAGKDEAVLWVIPHREYPHDGLFGCMCWLNMVGKAHQCSPISTISSTSLPLVDGFHGFQDSCSMELSLRIQGCSGCPFRGGQTSTSTQCLMI